MSIPATPITLPASNRAWNVGQPCAKITRACLARIRQQLLSDSMEIEPWRALPSEIVGPESRWM